MHFFVAAVAGFLAFLCALGVPESVRRRRHIAALRAGILDTPTRTIVECAGGDDCEVAGVVGALPEFPLVAPLSGGEAVHVRTVIRYECDAETRVLFDRIDAVPFVLHDGSDELAQVDGASALFDGVAQRVDEPGVGVRIERLLAAEGVPHPGAAWVAGHETVLRSGARVFVHGPAARESEGASPPRLSFPPRSRRAPGSVRIRPYEAADPLPLANDGRFVPTTELVVSALLAVAFGVLAALAWTADF